MLFRRTKNRRPSGLEWGIRESLTSYVAHLPDGVVAVDGVADLVDGAHPPRFFFPEVSRARGEVRFGGTVQIIGHRGMLRITACDPWLAFGDGRAFLSLIPSEGAARVVIAVLPAVEGEPIDAVGAQLTADGAAWLGPQYSEADDASVVTYAPTESNYRTGFSVIDKRISFAWPNATPVNNSIVSLGLPGELLRSVRISHRSLAKSQRVA